MLSTPSTSRPLSGSAYLRLHILCWLAAGFGTIGLHAQEMSFLTGGGALPNLRESSYSWDIDYRQHLSSNVSASVSWINEGHITGHHRDGTAAQLWLELPVFKDHLIVSAGAGGYYYFDTQPLGNNDSADIHGSAPMVSFGATSYFSDRWFARLLINRINPRHDFRSNTALVGFGYWFGPERESQPPKPGATPLSNGYVTGNELTIFGGESVVNASFSGHGLAGAAEFRRGLAHHLDGTISYIYEGDPRLVRRSGIAAQIWPVNTFYEKRVSVGIGLGGYVYIDNKHPRPTRRLPLGASVNTPAVAPLVSPTFSYLLSDDWLIRVVWDRVVTNYNRDSDVFLIGWGYRWR